MLDVLLTLVWYAAAVIFAGTGVYTLFTFVLMAYEQRRLALERGFEHLETMLREARYGAFASALWHEWLASFFMAAGRPYGWLDWNAGEKYRLRKGDIPVLCIHGFTQNRINWFFLRRHLRREGFSAVYTINLNPMFAPIETYALQVSGMVKRILEDTGASQIDLVGHSMGGIVARYYVAALDGAATVRRVVTLGSPHLGTRFAVLGSGPQSRQLVWRSPFLRELEAMETTLGGDGPAYTSIYSQHDNLVQPPETGRLPGAATHELSRVGHLTLLTAAATARLVSEALRAPDVARETISAQAA